MSNREKIIHYAYVAAAIVYFLFNYFKKSGDTCGSRLNQAIALLLIGIGLVIGRKILTKALRGDSWAYLAFSFLLFFIIATLTISPIYLFC